MQNKNKIIICGGHFSPALSVILSLKKKSTSKIYFIGRKFALEGDQSKSLEYLTCKRLKIEYFSIDAARLQRSFGFTSLFTLAKFPIGFLQSFNYLFRLKPAVVVSFGSYVALPICLSAWLLKIPIVIHEQTTVLGLANKITAKWAKALCLSFSDTKNIPRGVETIFTGNPIRKEILSPKTSSIIFFGDRRLPLLYITGGSLGSQVINRAVSPIITRLVQYFRIIHQCGSAENSADYKMLLGIKNELPLSNKRNYLVRRHIEPEKVGSILKHAQLVIGRSGANTVVELGISGVFSILVPLPWAGSNEQYYNAKFLQDKGMANIIPQSQLTSDLLLTRINSLRHNLTELKKEGTKLKTEYPVNASDTIAQIILSNIH